MVKKRYVIDTNGIITFYDEVFIKSPLHGRSGSMSTNTRTVIQEAINPFEGGVLLSVPSIVFIEIYEKWLRTEEFFRKFFYEVFIPLKQSPNVEIRSLDQEVLENLLTVDGCLAEHDLHDKIVVASAITLECPLITSDDEIIKFVGKGEKSIPKVFN